MTMSRQILPRIRNVSDGNCRENENTYFIYSKLFSRKLCLLRDNVEESSKAREPTDYRIIRRMRLSCWITKATDTYSEYVTLIAFLRQQCFRERASMSFY